MKIKLEPDKFRKLLEAGMIYKKQPMLEPMVLNFAADGVIVSDTYADIIAVCLEYKKEYFDGYSVEKPTKVTVPSVVLNRLSWGFNDEKIEVSSDGKKVSVEGKQDYFDTEIEDVESKKYPFPLKKVEHGMIPEAMELESAVILDAKELKLPPGRQYHFSLKDKVLTVKMSDGGNFRRRLECEVIKGKDMETTLDGDYFSAIANNLENTVLFVLDDRNSVFSECGEHYTKTFMLCPLV